MFREALGYPTRSPEGGRSVALGGIALLVVAVCVGVATLEPPYAYLAVVGFVPWLLVRGYYVRVVRTTIGRERPRPPRFGDVRRLLADGATAIWIAFLYLVPPVIVLGPLVALQLFEIDLSALLAAWGVSGALVGVLLALVGLLAVVALMALLGALYVLPVAVGRFAHADEWRRALELRTVVDGAFTEDYAIAWGVSVLLQVVVLPFAYLLRVILVGFFLQFLVAVGVRYCYGQGVGAAFGLDPAGTVPTDAAESEADTDTETPIPAVTRVDTESWGVSPGEDAEAMSKSIRFERAEGHEDDEPPGTR